MIISNDASLSLHTKNGQKEICYCIGIVFVAIAIGAAIFTSSANRPAETSISGGNPPSPVLLVHGLGEDASMWKKWEELLAKDGIQYHTITFQDSDDKCGTAIAHG